MVSGEKHDYSPLTTRHSPLFFMPDTFVLELTTPERIVAREDAEEAQIPLTNGYIGVLPGHAPLLGEVRPGELSYRQEGRTHYVAVSKGYVEVLPDRTKVLVETAERPAEIDVKRAESARERAENRLKNPTADIDVERAQAAIDRALVRLQVASHR